jgi:hypothetical protein
MPSRTVVYGVGAATGVLVGAVIARRLGALAAGGLLQRLLGSGATPPAEPTHIVLPDLVPPVAHGTATEGTAPEGLGATSQPLAPA